MTACMYRGDLCSDPRHEWKSDPGLSLRRSMAPKKQDSKAQTKERELKDNNLFKREEVLQAVLLADR